MRSTALGHPGEPVAIEALPEPFERLKLGNFGLSFDHAHDGLRGRLQLDREVD